MNEKKWYFNRRPNYLRNSCNIIETHTRLNIDNIYEPGILFIYFFKYLIVLSFQLVTIYVTRSRIK